MVPGGVTVMVSGQYSVLCINKQTQHLGCWPLEEAGNDPRLP